MTKEKEEMWIPEEEISPELAEKIADMLFEATGEANWLIYEWQGEQLTASDVQDIMSDEEKQKATRYILLESSDESMSLYEALDKLLELARQLAPVLNAAYHPDLRYRVIADSREAVQNNDYEKGIHSLLR